MAILTRGQGMRKDVVQDAALLAALGFPAAVPATGTAWHPPADARTFCFVPLKMRRGMKE